MRGNKEKFKIVPYDYMYVLTNGNKYADGKYLCVCDTIPKNQDRDTNTAYPVRMRTSLQRFHELGHIHQHKARDW